jgi:hypothetical protein
MGFLSSLFRFGPRTFTNAPRTLGVQASGATTPGPEVVNAGMGNYFEALRQSKDRTTIPYTAGALGNLGNRVFSGMNRRQLAVLGRYLCDNGGPASYAVNQIADYSVPVYPQAASPNADWNKLAENWFSDWSKRADLTGRFDFPILQRLACKAIDTDGDKGASVTIKHGFPQIRFYDAFHIGTANGIDPNEVARIDAFIRSLFQRFGTARSMPRPRGIVGADSQRGWVYKRDYFKARKSVQG